MLHVQMFGCAIGRKIDSHKIAIFSLAVRNITLVQLQTANLVGIKSTQFQESIRILSLTSHRHLFLRCIRNRMSKVKLIIDTDPGIDDAVAIAAAIKSPDADVLALTCVNGNVTVDQCCKNALKILDVFDRKDIPVYRGAERPLLGGDHDATYYHGEDGLADCVQHIPYPDSSPVEGKHAALAIIDLAKKYPGEIVLAAIGPLTNLALAHHLCPSLSQLLKRIVILGGNYTSLGNVTPTAEFNFYCDPEAAAAVLKLYECPIEIIPWEVDLEQILPPKFWQEYCHQPNKRSEFLGKMILSRMAMTKQDHFDISDAFAVTIAIDASITLKKEELWATVETAGFHTRGMMVTDRRSKAPKPKRHIDLILETDLEKIRKMLFHSVS